MVSRWPIAHICLRTFVHSAGLTQRCLLDKRVETNAQGEFELKGLLADMEYSIHTGVVGDPLPKVLKLFRRSPAKLWTWGMCRSRIILQVGTAT